MSIEQRCGAAQVTARWVRDEAGFAALGEDWNCLCEAMPLATVFHRHEWYAAAWQWLRRSHTLAILVVERGTVPIGIVPLVRRLAPLGNSPLARRVLEFLLVPDSQCCDLIAPPEHLPAVTTALAAALRDTAGEWEELRLRLLPANAPSIDPLRAALGTAGLRPQGGITDRNPLISLAGSWQDYYAGRSRRLKKGNNLIANHLQKAGAVELQRIHGVLGDRAIDRLLETLTTVSAQSWKQRTGNTLDQTGPGAFFADLTRVAGRSGWLSIWLLRLNGQVIATEFQLCHGGRVHALRADFDPAYSALSPGTYLNWKLLEAVFQSGETQYFFGPGDNPYKQRWAQDAATLLTLSAWSPSLRGRLGHFWQQRLRPWAKRLLHRTPASIAPDAHESA